MIDDHIMGIRISSLFFVIKGRRLEMLVLDGSDPDEWILRADRYCMLNRFSNEERLEVAVISFEGGHIVREIVGFVESNDEDYKTGGTRGLGRDGTHGGG